MRPMFRQKNPVLWTGFILACIASGAAALNFTGVAVIVDLPIVALIIVSLSIPMLILGLWLETRKHDAHKLSLGFGIAGLLVSLIIFIVFVQMKFFSYKTEAVLFKSGAIELAGTVYTPRIGDPHPAVILVHSSGPETRSEYRYFAERFARAKITALAYDKRGTGLSTGKLYEADYYDYANDVLAAAQYLKQREDVIASCIAIVGFSEAEWVAPIAASQSTDIAFLVVVAASGVSPAEQVNEEIAIRLREHGYSEEVVARALALNDRVFEYQRTGQGAELLRQDLRSAQQEPWFKDAHDIPQELYPPGEYDWWRSVMDFPAGSMWAQVKVPVLLVKGGQDPNSTADIAKREIESAFDKGGNQNFEFVLFPNADHSILEWPLGRNMPPPVFANGYPDVFIKWVSQQNCVTE